MKNGFQKATKKRSKARIALLGPSGAGKTYSALEIGKHLGKKLAVIDTERGSASKYAGDVADFDALELATFGPQHYIDALAMAAAEGYDVVVVDSLSHAWMGEGGILDQKDKKGGNGFDAWRTLTPQHNALIEAILAYPGHVIATMRSKMEYVQEKNAQGKTTIRKVGMAPIQRDGMEYEFDVIGDLDVDHTLHVTKSRCVALADAMVRKPGKEFAEKLLAWLDQGAVESRPTPAPTTTSTSTKPAAASDSSSGAQTSSGTGTSASKSTASTTTTSAPATGGGTTATSDKKAPTGSLPATLDLAEAVTTAQDPETLAWAFNQIEEVVGGSAKMTAAMKALIEQRSSQLADVAWAGSDDEKKAVAWLREQLEKRTDPPATPAPTTPATA